MTEPADRSDPTRCISTHWFLLLGCELPRGHRDNWHQGRDAANTTIRYRRTIGVTEAYRDGEWQPTDVPTPDGLDWQATESVLNFAGQRGDTDTITVVDGLTRQNDALLARVRELEAENQRLAKDYAAEERLHTQTITERDTYHDMADALAAAIAPVEIIGEHSSDNCPWQNALDHAAEQQPDGPALTGWAADMADASLTPYDGALTLDADDAPFVRLHFAFAEDMPDADRLRFLTQLGRIILAKL
jgi:hypothetical protein